MSSPNDILLDQVRVTYGRTSALDGVSLRLHPGDVVGLVGPSGGGKTTLVKTLATLVRPSRGRVLFGDQNPAALRARERQALRATIGMQFQNFALFDSLTVVDNVAYPLLTGETTGQMGNEARARASRLLAQVGLSGSEELFPQALSGGMKRRVAVARALVAEPRLTLFDDPTSGLDPVNSARILNLVVDQAAGPDRIVVMVSHDLDRLLPLVNRVLVLAGARLLYDGPAEPPPGVLDPLVSVYLGREEA